MSGKYDYGPITNTAERLINRFGSTITIERDSSSLWVKSYDRIKGEVIWTNSDTGEVVRTEPTSGLDSFSVNGVLTDFSSKEVDGTLIKATDKKLLIENTEVPKLGDVFVVGGNRFKYIDHDTVAPNAVAIIFIVQVRV